MIVVLCFTDSAGYSYFKREPFNCGLTKITYGKDLYLFNYVSNLIPNKRQALAVVCWAIVSNRVSRSWAMYSATCLT